MVKQRRALTLLGDGLEGFFHVVLGCVTQGILFAKSGLAS